jgi:hypothetical protein
VTTEPASHGEREQVIGALKAAFVQGRLTKAEFDARVGQALTSPTHAELAAAAALALSGVVIFTLFVTGYQVRDSRHRGPAARPLPPGTAS